MCVTALIDTVSYVTGAFPFTSHFTFYLASSNLALPIARETNTWPDLSLSPVFVRMDTLSCSIPSLLMQAARSAAIADGLVPENKSSPATAPSQTKDADRVSAALAMVAAVNGTNVGDSATAAPKNLTNSRTSNPSSVSTGGTSSSTPTSSTASNTSGNGLGTTSNSATASSGGNMPARPAPATGASTAMAPPAQQLASQTATSSMSAPKRPAYPNASASMVINNPSSAGSAAHRLALASHTQSSMQPPPLKTSTTLPPPVSSHVHSHVPQATISAPRASSSGSGSSKKKGPPLRRGKWTPEEEAYANRLIMEFKSGLLPLTDGTTLRTFLSKLLNCDPMRISKKFVGNNCIGKQVFRRRTADINRLTPEQIQQSRAELSE